MALYLILTLLVAVCGALDDVTAENNTHSKLIDWEKPLHFKNIVDSKDVKGDLFGGFILTAVILALIVVLAALLLAIYLVKERISKSNRNYDRLYDKNITSVQTVAQKV